MERTEIEAAIGGLAYDFTQFTIDHFVQHLAQTRGRRILVVPFLLSQDTSGAYVKAKHHDYIMYNVRRHRVLQTHIILHEIAHMILGHKLHTITDIQGNLPHDLALIPARFRFNQPRRLLQLEKHEEQEAELFVRLIQTQIARYHTTSRLYANGLIVTTIPPFSLSFDPE